MFVFPFNFSHRQQAVDQIRPTTTERMVRGCFILNDVSTLQPARTIHRREPPAEVAHQSEHSAHQSRAYLPYLVWTSAETFEHLADQLTVMPLLVFNLLDACSFFGITHRMPMAAICVTGGTLTRIGHL
jgi:hypothetical protein